MSVSVVIADDQAPFRRAARAVVAAADEFRLIGEAASGSEVLELVDSLHPDMVLMDIAMPGLGGIEAARAVAHASPETITVLVSTYREQDLPDAARSCGAAAYLHKSQLDADALQRLWKEHRQ